MRKVTYEEGNLIFIDGDKRNVLLDTGHLMLNRSRYPMQPMGDGRNDIPSLIVDLAKDHEEIGGRKEDLFAAYLLDILLASYLIRTSAPLKVLEIGATSGILSYHLATLMGKLNKESTLCCVSNVIGNTSENYWLDRVSLVEETPNLSILVSDYEDTQLETAHFDIVVLNGAERFDKPYETIREAERLIKKDGVLLCHVKDAPLLESCFKLVFPERREYEISQQEMILAVTDPGNSWEQEKLPVLEDEVSKLLYGLRQVIGSGCRPEKAGSFIQEIDRCVDLAMEYLDIDRKVGLIQLKGSALDYMLNIGKEFEEYYRNDMMEKMELLRTKERA